MLSVRCVHCEQTVGEKIFHGCFADAHDGPGICFGADRTLAIATNSNDANLLVTTLNHVVHDTAGLLDRLEHDLSG